MIQRIAVALTVLALSSPASAAVAPSPSPAPAAPASQLRVIASVRSTPRCAEIVTHANSAIGTALDDDLLIGQTVTRLRLVNLDDGNPIHRHNGLNALGDLAKNLMKQARSGDDEVKRLRALAHDSKDPQEQKDLADFANALGGALWRQQKIARDLNGYLAAVDFQDMAKFDDGQQQMNQATFGVSDPLTDEPAAVQQMEASNKRLEQNASTYDPRRSMTPGPLGHERYTSTATQEAQAAAADFQAREPSITTDENSAAHYADGAFKNC